MVNIIEVKEPKKAYNGIMAMDNISFNRHGRTWYWLLDVLLDKII